jgi:hypothetical protein
MPGLVPGIHVLRATWQRVDGRDKPGHDACWGACAKLSSHSLQVCIQDNH